MIITIKGADFSSANIGTLSTYIISKSIGSGAAFDIPNFVDKNSSVNWVITLDEGYTFGTYSVTMGGVEVTPTVVDNVMTISIAEVTGNVRIVVATVNENTGEDEPDEPVVPPVTPDEPDEPETPTGFQALTGGSWRTVGDGGNRYCIYATLPAGAVVDFKSPSDWDTYKYAIGEANGGDRGAASSWIGGGYQSGAYTITDAARHTIMVARQDNAVMSEDDKAYIEANMGYTI
jgi:hypothetical protein